MGNASNNDFDVVFVNLGSSSQLKLPFRSKLIHVLKQLF